MSVEAFGAQARRFAEALDGVDVLVADASDPATALAACARRRRSGVPFLSCVLLDDPRALVAYEYAAELLAASVDEDARRRLFDGLAAQALKFNEVAQSSIATVAPAVLGALRDISLMAEGMLVRSWSEAERLAGLFGRRRDLVVRVAHADLLPRVDPGEGDAIVVWAAGISARHTAIYAYALADFHLPVLIACNDRPAFATRGVEYVAPTAGVLQRAALLLDVSIGGPSAALALAALGKPLASPAPTGAGEYLAGVTPFEPWSWRSIQAAVQRGLAGGLPWSSAPLPTAAAANGALQTARAQIPREGPLVSVVIPTYNRRSFLPRALDSLAKQEYRDLEIVVVNDGGEAVDDIVARYPNARLIENPSNLGITGAANAGLHAAKGTYLALLSDDDAFYPDTIGRFAWALTRTGARVVHGNSVMRFDRKVADGVEAFGYQLVWKESVDHRDSLYTPHTSAASTMFHRETLERLGFLEESPVMDIELLLRLSRVYDFLHVDHPVVEIEYDPDKGQGKRFAEMAVALEEVYRRYPSDSADVAAGRRTTLDWYAKSGAAGFFFQPEISLPEPELRREEKPQ